MQIKDVRPESFTRQIRCDRCGRQSELGEVEFHESVSLELKAGYGSIFGDGNDVQIDLCQHCLKDLLGHWLRVSEPMAIVNEPYPRLRGHDLVAAQVGHCDINDSRPYLTMTAWKTHIL